MISATGERGAEVMGPSLHALLKNCDGGSVHQHYPQICRCRCIVKAMRSILLDPESARCLSSHMLRQDARGGGKYLHLHMTRKLIKLAGEDCAIVSVSARQAISFDAASIQVRSSMFRVVSPGKIERILRFPSMCRKRQVLVPSRQWMWS